ncbi:MAG: LLM class F420-dependent oxidoreductase [Myxococcota bacterium]|nr:LLM class F420-dependent oxidoreductase [Myxococcota bacterium]
MKLGLALPWANPKVELDVRRVQLAERLGFDSVWTAEAYGQDALTPLAFLAGHTRRIRLGTAVAQVAARPPAALAMAAATLDQLAGEGRMVIGLGLSGPQIVEGWYGQPWGRPNPRMRDYVTILRKVLRREGPVIHDGPEIALPYRGPGSSGLGKPLKCILHTNRDVPIFLATGGRRNVALTAELADGWLPMGFVPGMLDTYRPWLEEGAARAGRRVEDLEIQAGCQVAITDDVAGALRRIKSFTAFYVGGMGHQTKNFHKDAMVRRGHAEAAERIQELFLAGRREEAVDAVPDAYVDDGALVGPEARIRERFRAWRDSGATGLTLHTSQDEALELLADLAETRP